MAEDLSPADRSSLAAEQGPVNMAVGGVLVFAAEIGYERLLERIGSRLHLVPRYRQRLQHAAPGITNPAWVDDDHFDLRWHVRVTRLSAPGSDAQLAELVGTEMSRRLDRARPLWEVTLVEGLEGGRNALLAKMHHALVDGIAAIDIGTVILDPTPEPLDLRGGRDDVEWAPRPYDRRRHLAKMMAMPALRAQRALLDAAQRALTTDPRRAAEDLRRATELMTQLARTRPAAPMTSLNRGIGPNRSYALRTAPLQALKDVAKPHGATVNDAILAAVAGTLRAVAPGVDPVALVPVSVRQSGEEGGNRFSTVLVDLPTHVADPLERMRLVHEQMARLKDSAAVRAGALLVGASGWAPPLVSSALARAMSGVRAFNLVVSNLPGPQQPFYLSGVQLERVHPIVPLNPASQGLTVGVLSYDGTVCFGLLADRALDPPLETVSAALADALGELIA
jgi:diacylglycerol O-acyltransferase / wax synthase